MPSAKGKVALQSTRHDALTAISGTSANTYSVSTLDTGFADPDMDAMRQKVNDMILNGRR